MSKKSITNTILATFVTLIVNFSVVAESLILDENGKKTGLINLNPNPDGEPWIGGGINMADWDNMVSGLEEFELDANIDRALAPDKVNNTESSAFRPIFNQKGGSCAQASSIAYVFTYEINTLRGLASSTLKNQYPYGFSYNFTNKGSGKNGSMPDQGYEIAMKMGIPDAQSYGGFGLGKHDKWISGYDVYYGAMKNRASSRFTINVGTAQGINTMRNWFDNHGVGDSEGGCLVYCYNSSGSEIKSLPSGTPEGGKKVYTKFGDKGGHAVTIAGYNDSVRYDYNGDGKYTNDIDITGDGKVGVEDWEIGATIMVNSWGTKFGNSGKIYTMYRLCAIKDGMWSKKVYGMKISEENVLPKLTLKATIDHNKRDQIRIRAGVSNNTNATKPDKTISFGKGFNYAGGDFGMCGSGGSSSLELGLDLTPLLSNITGTDTKIFLEIISKGGSGQVKSFSVIDYESGTPVETMCDQQNVSISSGNTTYLSIVFNGQSKISVVYPNGGEKFELSSTQTIAWGDNIDGKVKIDLYKGGTLEETLADATESDGKFDWTIADNQKTGEDYTIKISSIDDATIISESNKAFTIEKEFIINTFPHIEDYEGLVSGEEVLPERWAQLVTDDLNSLPSHRITKLLTMWLVKRHVLVCK